ncbi:MAG: GNAT family N-acetyltransferase [Anaerolineaceae bacterium]|nr:GNAT family N-acetyltransferase [Anaerolineaceae bacterium]
MISIKSPNTKEEYRLYYELRYKVLREPWGQPKGTEKDDYEPISQHLMLVDEEKGEVVGCIKFFEKEPGIAWFSHLAIKIGRQRMGFGKQLLTHVEALAREQGFKKIGCQSRLNTTSFFERMGYQINGMPTGYFGNTMVVWMEKDL